MTNILFIYAKLNPEISYIQGMNEILAPLLFVFGTDPSSGWSDYAEADTFFCFCTVMKSLKVLYLKSPADQSKTGIYTQMQRLSRLLRQHDPVLWQHLVRQLKSFKSLHHGDKLFYRTLSE